MSHRIISIVLLPAICAFSAGCGGGGGPELVPAGGVVLYQGGPLAGARVTFVPASKGSVAMASTNSEGKFELRTGTELGVVADTCTATVSMIDPAAENELKDEMTPEDMQRLQMEGKLEAMMAKANKSLIPKKYSRADTSGLSFEVKEDAENQFTIELKD